MADRSTENKLKKRLAHYEEDPPMGAWNQIENELTTPKNRAWVGLGGVFVLLLIGSVSTFYLLSSSSLEGQKPEFSDVTSQGHYSKLEPRHELDSNSYGATRAVNLNTKDEGLRVTYTPDSIESQEEQKLKQFTRKDHILRFKDESVQATKQPDYNAEHNVNHSILERDNLTLLPNPIKALSYKPIFKRPSIAKITKIDITLIELITHTDKGLKEEKELADRKVALYFQGMPTINFNRFEANATDDQWISKIERIPSISMERLGVRLEAGITYKINSRVSLLAGVLYFDRKQSIEYSLRVVDSLVAIQQDGNILLQPEYSQENRIYNYRIQNMGIQLGFTYSIPSDKFETFIGSGMEFHKSLKTDSRELFQEPSFYIFYNLFYRIEYPKDKRFRFMAQPSFNYSLDISKDLNAPIFVKPYGFGLNFGFTFKL